MHPIGWEVVSQPLKASDSSIDNLRLPNDACLANWLWYFFQESRALWQWIIVSTLGAYPLEWVSGSRILISFRNPYEAISSVVPLFQFMKCPIGNGSDSYFWEEFWVVEVLFAYFSSICTIFLIRCCIQWPLFSRPLGNLCPSIWSFFVLLLVGRH